MYHHENTGVDAKRLRQSLRNSVRDTAGKLSPFSGPIYEGCLGVPGRKLVQLTAGRMLEYDLMGTTYNI